MTLQSDHRAGNIMAIELFAKPTRPRCHSLGGPDARVIMSLDEAALIRRLWTSDHSCAHAATSPTAPALLLRPIRGKYSRASHKQRQTAVTLPTLMSGIRRLLKAYAILWQKLYARFSEHTFDQGNRVLVSRVATHLDIRDRVSMKTGRLSQVPNRPIQRSTRHPDLCTCHRHEAVPLSHVARVTAHYHHVAESMGDPVNFKSSEPITTGRSREPNRRQFLGGSDARIIMSPDELALIRLWKEKRGEAEPEDLSGNLIVQLGIATETLNRTWYERNAGRAVTDVQRWVRHPVHRYLAATLDGFVNDLDAVFEAKFMLPWSFSEEAAAEKHMAQLQHNMWVTNARSAALSIITGGGKWIEMTIPADALYQHFLITAERRFWRCVQTGETPRPYGIEPPRPRIEAVRVVDMSESNS